MDTGVVTNFRHALASRGTNQATADYLEARLSELKEQLMFAKDDAYRQIQGRAIEVSELLKLVKQLREP